MKNRLLLTLFRGTLKKEIKYNLRIIFNEMNKTLLKIIKIKFNTKEYELKYLYIYIIKMNITLDLSSAQLVNLRIGKGIRISPAMFVSGVDMIVDTGNYYNLLKNLKEVKERLCQWETMNWKRMKYKGLCYSLVLKKVRKNITN